MAVGVVGGAGVVLRLGVLASGRGTNLQAILDACARGDLPASVAVVVSDRADAQALERARRAGVPAIFVDPRGRKKADFEAEISRILREHGVELVCLAGYMRVLGRTFLREWEGRVLNIHPSLLPAFPGLEAQRQAWDYGVKVSGCTVHFVVPEVDAGPIILQAAVPVLGDDTPESLAARILEQEHRIYVEAIRLYAEGRLRIEGRRVVILPPGEPRVRPEHLPPRQP
ncbi:MAG: phosphoribosylglycinamide formyltransferase [Firmicutes bacterium]|nr:phosphoribosylglycinamide formyltransferase [Bacillota bacterium]